MKRVVVTGIGCVTPAGNNVLDTWNGLIHPKNYFSSISDFGTEELFQKLLAGRIMNFDEDIFPVIKKIDTDCVATRYCVSALNEALLNANMINSKGKKISISLGVGAETKIIEKNIKSPELLSPIDATKNKISYISKKITEIFNIECIQNRNFSAACAAGNYAIADGFDLVRSGKSDVAIVGGVTILSFLNISLFNRLGIYSDDLCRPFDKDRKGLIMSEAAAFLILEDYEQAKNRDVEILAEVSGYGITCDAYHPVAPDPKAEGSIRAIKKALQMANVSSENIDYVSAHGTATPGNDLAEVIALKSVFGDNLSKTPISSIKSMIGHSFAAATAIEAIICCKILKEKIIPPTFNYVTPDPECDIDCVPNMPRELSPNFILNNSFAFGGYNAITVFKKV